jgi:hypothetical protein
MDERQREEGSEGKRFPRRRSGAVHRLDWAGSSLRNTAKRTGEWTTHDLPRAVSPKRLLRRVAKRAVFALVRRHLGVVAAVVGTLAFVGTGGYFVGRHSRR